MAWEIREWPVVLWSSAWLTIAYLKLKRPAQTKQILERAFAEMPARALDDRAAMPCLWGTPTRQSFRRDRTRVLLEEGAGHCALGQVYEALGAPRGEAEAAFRSSLAVLEQIQIQCLPELAQTLFARFRRGNNAGDDTTLIKSAVKLFEEMNAKGWIDEARVALNLAESHRQ